jgi:hypothetical protein
MTEDELTHNASPLIARYRKIKTEVDDRQTQLGELRESISRIILEEGDYQDDVGYAKFRSRKESPSYSSKAVEKLAQVWAKSDDPVLAQCGQLLLAERSVTPAKTYITIK